MIPPVRSTGNEHPTEKKVIPVSPALIEIIRCNTRCTAKAASSTLRPNALPSTSRSRCRCRHRNSAASLGSHRGLITWAVALKNKEVDLVIGQFCRLININNNNIIITIIIMISNIVTLQYFSLPLLNCLLQPSPLTGRKCMAIVKFASPIKGRFFVSF